MKKNTDTDYYITGTITQWLALLNRSDIRRIVYEDEDTGNMEQAEAIAKIDYIHANSVRRKLVAHPGDLDHSSWRFYEREEQVGLELKAVVL